MDVSLFFWFLMATSSGDVKEDCLKLHPVDSDMLMVLNNTGTLVDESQKEPKCFVQCLLERATMMSEDNKLNVDELKTILQDVEDAVTSCAAGLEDEEDKCEKAYQFVKCVTSASSKISSTGPMESITVKKSN